MRKRIDPTNEKSFDRIHILVEKLGLHNRRASIQDRDELSDRCGFPQRQKFIVLAFEHDANVRYADVETAPTIKWFTFEFTAGDRSLKSQRSHKDFYIARDYFESRQSRAGIFSTLANLEKRKNDQAKAV